MTVFSWETAGRCARAGWARGGQHMIRSLVTSGSSNNNNNYVYDDDGNDNDDNDNTLIGWSSRSITINPPFVVFDDKPDHDGNTVDPSFVILDNDDDNVVVYHLQ